MHCKINDAEDFTRQPELFTAFCEIDRLNLQSPMVFILSRRRPCHILRKKILKWFSYSKGIGLKCQIR